MGNETPPQSPDPNDPFREYVERAREYWKRADDATREYTLRAWEFIRDWSGRAWEQIHAGALAIAAWVSATSASLRQRWNARQQARADRPPEPGRPRDPRRQRRPERQSVPNASIIVARSEDDVASVTGRIDTADDIDVVLVVPRSARRLRQPSAWAHLAAHSRRRGMVLRVVSPRRDVRAHARANGLRAASRLRSLQRSGFRIGEHTVRMPSLHIGGLLRLAIVAGVVSALALLVLYRVPSATITVVPEADEFTTSREVRVSPILDSSNIEDGVVRAESIRETITTLITTATTGEAEVGEAVASVTLRFTNEGDGPVEIPGNTTVTDEEESVSFVVADSFVVLPGEPSDVPAQATDPGGRFNVAAGTLVVSNGLPDGVTVTNATAAEGGSDQMVRAVSEEDVARVSAIADDVLEEIAERSLANMLEEGVVFFPETLSTAVFEAIPLQQVEEPADVLLVEYTIVVSAFGLNPAVASDFGAAMIRDELPEGRALLPGTTTTTTQGDLRVEGGQMFVTLEATGMVTDITDLDELRSELAGLRPHEAQALIEERVPLLGPPHVSISPSLIPWRWLPRSSDRIEIVLAGPDFFEPDEDEEDADDETDDLLPELPEDDDAPLEPFLPTPVPGGGQTSPGG